MEIAFDVGGFSSFPTGLSDYLLRRPCDVKGRAGKVEGMDLYVCQILV